MKITIDSKEIEVEEKKTILTICDELGIDIPSLCFHKDFFPEARCRVCLVEMDGKLVTSCSTYPHEGTVIITDSEAVKKARQTNLDLMTPGSTDEEVCKLFKEVGMGHSRFKEENYLPSLGDAILRDDKKCINCGICVSVCDKIQAISALGIASRGHDEHISSYGDKKLEQVACIKCGQCIINCPVGALSERSHIEEVETALNDPNKHLVVQTAPSIRVALGEEFGMEPGTIITGKLVAVLRKLGFDKIFDVALGADLTIMEEASELLRRVKGGGPFPMITSCCPGWVLMSEYFYHELFPNLSTCRSPHEMLGMMIKTYYAEKSSIDTKNIVVVSIMPCTAKKFESIRPELDGGVDYVLTTRELGTLIKRKNIDFVSLTDEEFDSALGFPQVQELFLAQLEVSWKLH